MAGFLIGYSLRMRSVLSLAGTLVALPLLFGTIASTPAAAQQWVPCAREGGVCSPPYPTTVRYGAAGEYVIRRTGGRIPCNNGVFGDPTPGIRKSCAYLAAAPDGFEDRRRPRFEEDDGFDRPRRSGWQVCAREGQFCEFSGPATVRYGVPGSYVTRRAFNGIACSNAAFGDPAFGVRKRCEVRFEPGRG